MIKVECEPQGGYVSVTGHAGAAPKGQDIVCAAASMLMYTLAAMVERMEAARLVKDVFIHLQPGQAIVSCHAAGEKRGRACKPFEMATLGMKLLAERYPEYVECKVWDSEWGDEEDDEDAWMDDYIIIL